MEGFQSLVSIFPWVDGCIYDSFSGGVCVIGWDKVMWYLCIEFWEVDA